MDLDKFFSETDFEASESANKQRQDELNKEASEVEVDNDCGDGCKI